MVGRLLSAAAVIAMRLGTGNAAAPGPLVWAVLPPERRTAAVALLAMLAARAAASRREAVTVSPAMYRSRDSRS